MYSLLNNQQKINENFKILIKNLIKKQSLLKDQKEQNLKNNNNMQFESFAKEKNLFIEASDNLNKNTGSNISMVKSIEKNLDINIDHKILFIIISK